MSNNKYLLKTNDDFQVDSFLYKLEKENPGHSCKKYYTPEDFLDKITSNSLFDDEKEISVLMELDTIGAKLIGTCPQEVTDAPIVLIQRKSIASTKAYTNITADYELKKLDSLKVGDCARWVGSTLTKRGIRHSQGVPDLIVGMVGNDQYALINEIDKISLVADRVVLDLNNTKDYIASSLSADYFSFIDHLTHLRINGTLSEFEKVDPSTYVKFIGFTVSQLEKFYKIGIYRSQNYTPEEIADIVGIPSFILKTKIFTIYSFVPKVKILKMIDLFLELSEKLRTSKYDKKNLFESYLLKILKV